MIINSSSTAFTIWTGAAINDLSLRQSMLRLSTGMIRTQDNPAGVGISERLRAQARSVGAARANVENGISMMQTADAWMQNISDMTGRMSELSIEAGDGTKSAEDIANLQTEFSELQNEVTRITSKSTAAAKFNGLYLFRGGNGQAAAGDLVDSGNISMQIGADGNQNTTLSLRDLSNKNTVTIGTAVSYTYSTNGNVTGSSFASVTWASIIDSTGLSVSSTNVTGKLAEAIDYIANARASYGAQLNRLESTRGGLLTYEDNLRASESNIRDVDLAVESINFAKFSIIGQSANAMLAQANGLGADVLSLIG